MPKINKSNSLVAFLVHITAMYLDEKGELKLSLYLSGKEALMLYLNKKNSSN